MQPLLLEIPPCFETARLRLRGYRPGDGAWYYAVGERNRAHLSRYESGNSLMSVHSEEEAEALVRRFAADWTLRTAFYLGAFEKSSGDFAAQVYVGARNWDMPEFDLGFFADSAHEGQGYVSEAVRATLGFLFTRLRALRVRGDCDDSNVRSARVFERCGFRLEGHFRQDHLWPDGAITGTLHYAMLREEYHVETP